MNNKEKFYFVKESNWLRLLGLGTAATGVGYGIGYGGRHLYENEYVPFKERLLNSVDGIADATQGITDATQGITDASNAFKDFSNESAENIEEAASEFKAMASANKRFGPDSLRELQTAREQLLGDSEDSYSSPKILAIMAGLGALAAGGGYLYKSIADSHDDEPEE